MFEVPTIGLRKALTSVLPFCGNEEPFDRVRFEVREDEVLVSSTTRYAIGIARAHAEVWERHHGLVFEVSVESVKKLLAVHVLAKNRGGAAHDLQKVLFELVDGDTALRTSDTSGLFPSSEALVVPLCEDAGAPDGVGFTGARLHDYETKREADDLVNPGDAFTISLRMCDAAVKQYKQPIVLRVTPSMTTGLVTVGGDFAATVGLGDPHSVDAEGTARPEVAWYAWLERLPAAKRDGLAVTGPESSAEASDDEDPADDGGDDDFEADVVDRVAGIVTGMREKGLDVEVVQGGAS